MKYVQTVEEIREQRASWAAEGLSVCLVPTMGYFHEGHLSLMREAKARADRVVVSLFVNPLQFGPTEDLDSYPRDLDRDLKLAESAGADIVFCPDATVMYNPHFLTTVTVDKLGTGLCGGSRPGHFNGVTTVVAKLFNIVTPEMAIFGQKDYQQLAIIKRMVADLNFNITVIGHPIVRAEDGLALSSRNTYLKGRSRKDALCLYNAICYARKKTAESTPPQLTATLVEEIKTRIAAHDNCRVDYVAIIDSRTLEDVVEVDQHSVLALAVYIDDTIRLIDNAYLVEQPSAAC